MTIQTYARIIGVLLLLSMIAGGIGEGYVPSKMLASNDAEVTARTIITSNALFRAGFASYLVEAVCDVALALLFYVLLAPVQKYLALFTAFLGLISTALFGVAEFFYFAPTLLLRDAAYLKTFTPQQLHTLALLSLKAYGCCGAIFMVFYGLASLLRGYLMFRSGYVPKLVGLVLALAGFSFIVRSLTYVLTPAYTSEVMLLPMFLALVVMTVWFLAKGVDAGKWRDAGGSLAPSPAH
ncbi:MAG: DUF4386 domain-containing protein [Acidobacteria bacterium]|nr:DUF4386 domain-containing protein [Acidobacteriota bacterium]MBV9476341.1 DUF4386 domain-containing protein [Acidobacteriota bacterium]